jgi:hypothetical protein
LFIPRNRSDTESPADFYDKNKSRLDRDLLVVDVGRADLDWGRFNFGIGDDICHPTPYGQCTIAEYLADRLGGEGLLVVR